MRDRRRPSELKTKSGHVRQCLHVANWVPEIASTETLRYVRELSLYGDELPPAWFNNEGV